jgi:hypothetical protein
MSDVNAKVPFALGDLVKWHGIELVVIELKPNGEIEALSPTWRVTAKPDEFEAST